MRPVERLHVPIVTARAGAADGVHVHRLVVRRLIDDVDDGHVRIALAEQLNPLLDLGLLIGRGQAAEPAWLLLTPHEVVLLEDGAVSHRVGVDRVEPGPVHLVLGPFDGAPLALVLRRNLVPVGREIRTDLTARGDVPNELAGAGLTAGSHPASSRTASGRPAGTRCAGAAERAPRAGASHTGAGAC